MSEKKQISICGFKQNCFRIGTSGGVVGLAKTPFAEQKKYTVLEKQMLLNGYVEGVVEKDYPITSASVTSYADGADYRNDPSQAIANAPTRVNLGDVTEAQKFLENPQNQLRVMRETIAKLEDYYSKNKSSNSPAGDPVNNNEGGAK